MDFTELAVSRRTVHSYTTEKVADALVEQALQLALWAPNHKLTFPYAFFWLGEKVRHQLAELAVELKSKKEPLSEIKLRTIRETVLNPSHVILIGTKRGAPERAHEDYATLACGVQNAALYLVEKGVSSKWSTGGFALHALTYEILGISADVYKLEGALLIGKPAQVPEVPARPALSQFVHRTL